eukprot:scaffold10835_cov153-Skeletonema_menzelii.AAC.4
MSADVGGENKACSGCGIAEGGDVKLKDCSACKLVKYCGIECQRKHRSQHKKDCKRRAAELRDELLFKQPESSHRGDCPICCLPLSLDKQKSVLMGCCLKMICNGCDYANPMDVVGVKICQKCPFCRLPTAKSQEVLESNLMKRVEANDPVAMYQMAGYRYQEKKFSGAIEYYTKAAGLGHAEAHYELSCLYHDGGKGVKQDKKRCLYHAEEAAIGGHPIARYNLASNEIEHGRFERAAKHWIIGAKLGHDNSLDGVKTSFKTGFVSKEDFAAALRAHQAAVDATKSPQRDEALVARQNMHNLDANPELRDRMMRSTFNRMSPDARRRARQNVRDGTFRMDYDI